MISHIKNFNFCLKITTRTTRLKHSARFFIALGISALSASIVHAETTRIEIWHAMTGVHESEFKKVVRAYNNAQDKVEVDLKGFDSRTELQAAAQKAVSGQTAKPDLVEIADNHSPDVIAQHKDILPLYQLLAKYPISDAAWFLPQTTSFVRDNKDRLLAFPFMAEVPVMFYNLDAYTRAGLDPKKPARTWSALQADLLALRDTARINCPYATSHQVEVHIENLAPINNQLFLLPDNGLKANKGVELNFNILYMRHVALMVSWRRTELFTQNSNSNEASKDFADGKCAVLTANSSEMAELLGSKVPFGVAPLPFYDQATKEPGAPFVSGSAFWAVAGQSPARNKATADFLGYLAKPVIAADWHQKTGFLPLTDAAYRAADVSFYSRIPGAQSVVQSLKQSAGKNSAEGFRMRNYGEVEKVLNKEWLLALEGNISAMTALNTAKAQAIILSGSQATANNEQRARRRN
jgi:multiple sugar transport system substrate-binding protein